MEDIVNDASIGKIIWTPTSEDTAMDKFRRHVNRKYGLLLENFWDLHAWSVANYPQFWGEVWKFVGIVHSKPYEQVVDEDAKFEDIPEWFRGARLNFAENCLHYNDDRVALYVTGESRSDHDTITYADLHQEVARYAAALKKVGVTMGDRVAGYITSCPSSVIALLATISLGAVWSAVLVEFGVLGVLDRLKQIQPKVIFAIDSCYRNGTKCHYLETLSEVMKDLSSVEKIVIVPFNKQSVGDISKIRNSCYLSDFLESGTEPDGNVPPLEFVQVPFDHPAFISYTSGTTGPPKALVHSGGGVLIQTLKETRIIQNLTRDDVLEVFAIAGWATFNVIIAHLSAGIAIVLYEGSPNCPPTRVWDLVDQLQVTIMWMFPFILDKCEADGVKPRKTHKLTTLRHILVGASCPKASNWNYILQDVKPGVHTLPITGATDILGLFGGFNLKLPVYFGEIESPSLGMGLECYDDTGQSVVGEKGELVITKPFPSMPLLMWNQNRDAIRKAYFSKFPGIWTQGDLIMINPKTRGIITLGRSDAVLNPKAARYGSSEIYTVVETIPEIADSVCVSQFNKQLDERAVLFLKMKPEYKFSEEIVQKVNRQIKINLTERHCPSVILETKDIPYTVSGKKMELAVKKAIAGEEITYRISIANPDCLDFYYNIPELQDF